MVCGVGSGSVPASAALNSLVSSRCASLRVPWILTTRRLRLSPTRVSSIGSATSQGRFVGLNRAFICLSI